MIRPTLDESWPANGLGSVEALFEQIPDPLTVPAGAWVAIDEGGPASTARSLRSLFARRRFAHRAVRCSALLARGYREVGSGFDGEGRDLAWGRAGPRATK